jgi:ketosteroid isomerase-like protein
MKLTTGKEELPEEEQKLAIANLFLTAMKTKDWDLMRSVMREDINWTLPGISILSGTANGIDKVIERAQSLRAFGVMFELKNILLGMEGVALALHNTAERNGLVLDEQVVIAFALKGGKIAAMTTYLSDVAGINQFFIEGII